MVAHGRHENVSFMNISRITQVHREERKGEELQPDNCAQVFFCKYLLLILSLFYLCEYIPLNLVMLYSGGGGPPVVTVYSKCMKVLD